jgi:hypothetical protein
VEADAFVGEWESDMIAKRRPSVTWREQSDGCITVGFSDIEPGGCETMLYINCEALTCMMENRGCGDCYYCSTTCSTICEGCFALLQAFASSRTIRMHVNLVVHA